MEIDIKSPISNTFKFHFGQPVPQEEKTNGID